MTEQYLCYSSVVPFTYVSPMCRRFSMARTVVVSENKEQGELWASTYLIDWCVTHPRGGLGGATGKSPIGVWRRVWEKLQQEQPDAREAVTGQEITFLDEYVGAYPSYYHWAWRNLQLSHDGLKSRNVYVPRGCFFDEHGRLVNSDYLEEILEQTAGEWEELTAVGEDGMPPEIRIKSSATHPVLQQIRDSLAIYDQIVRLHTQRLQILGVGVGGAIDKNPMAGGHIGFVECGAAARDTGVMLVRLARSTLRANESDFLLLDGDGDNTFLEPARYAITQGINTILSAGELLMVAWGPKKQLAMERTLLGTPGPYNPAAWVQEHPNVTVVLDRAAYGSLDVTAMRDRGFAVQLPTASPAVS